MYLSSLGADLTDLPGLGELTSGNAIGSGGQVLSSLANDGRNGQTGEFEFQVVTDVHLVT